MTDRDPPESRAGLKPALARLLSAGVTLLGTRVELASVELALERERLQRRLALLLAGLLLLVCALLGVAAFVVVVFWDSHPLLAIGGVTLAFATAGAWLVHRAAAIGRASTPPFAATVAELARDREAVAAMARAATERRS